MSHLFTVDFENNKLFDPGSKGFDIVANWGGTIEVAASAAYEGSYGCKLTPIINQSAQRACGMKKVLHLSRIRQAFYLHPNAITLADGKYIKICRSYHSDASLMHYQLHLHKTVASGYDISAGVGDNTGAIAYNSGVFILDNQNNWNLIELDWYAGSPGQFQLWINGASKWTRTVTNDLIRINYPSVGTHYCDDASVSGSYYIDYWRANDDGSLIGA